MYTISIFGHKKKEGNFKVYPNIILQNIKQKDSEYYGVAFPHLLCLLNQPYTSSLSMDSCTD